MSLTNDELEKRTIQLMSNISNLSSQQARLIGLMDSMSRSLERLGEMVLNLIDDDLADAYKAKEEMKNVSE